MNLKISNISDTFKYHGLSAGHWWLQISVSFEGIAANKQGIDAQWLPMPPLNLSAAYGYGTVTLVQNNEIVLTASFVWSFW